MDRRKLAFWLALLIVIAFELALMAYLVLGQRMVIGHDGFELLAHQWFFLNSKISHGEIPYWTPFMTHGLPTWWFFIYSRMDMFSNLSMFFSGWFEHVHFLTVYYGGLFFDKFVLLVGVWLLAKRFFTSPVTVFFVASTVMASTVAYTQNSFSLILVYSLPLIIELLHRFFDTGRFKWAFLALFLFCTVIINAYYFIPVITLAVFLYFVVAQIGRKIHLSIPSKSDIPWLFGILLLILSLAALFVLGHDSLIHIDAPERQADGSVPLNVFLSFAGGTDLFKWWELFLGISPQLDYTLYIGLLSLPLIILGAFFSKNAHRKPFTFGALFFILFACATPLAVAAYYSWPLMKYFRHIALVAPLVKLYFCFLAGFGFEQLFNSEKAKESKAVLYQSLLAGGILALNGIFLCQLIIKPELAGFMLSHMGDVLLTAIQANFSLNFLSNSLFYMVIFSFLAATAFFVRPFVKFPQYASSFLLILMLLHVMDLYWYAYQQIQLRTFSMTEQQSALLDFQKIPYAKRREVSDVNPREALMASFHKGAMCDSANNFTLNDMPKSKYRVDFCLKPYEKLFKVFNYKTDSPIFLKLVGASEDKIQFFSQAYAVSLDQVVENAIKNKDYAGDILFYQSAKATPASDLKDVDLSQNQRLALSYKVLSFSPNQIVIEVDTANQEGVWMQYCDAWYPAWKAKINGKPQEIYIGNLAYKTVPLEKGKNKVHLYYESNAISALYSFFTASSLAWLLILFWLIIL